MTRLTLFILSGVVAMIAAGLVVYTGWLRIIQTGDSDAEALTPKLFVAALVLLVAGFIRKR